MTSRPLSNSLASKIERASAPCPEHPWVPRLAAVLTNRAGVEITRRLSFALYVVLLLLAHKKTGRVLVTKDSLAELFGVTSPEIDAWLIDLGASRLIRVLSGGNYLVIVIEKWRSECPKQSAPLIEFPSKMMPEIPPSIPPPGSVLLRPAQKTSFVSASRILQNRTERIDGDGVEGPGGGEEGWRENFLDRLVEALDAPEERRSLETFCRPYPKDILEAALLRVEKTPLSKIKKSRGALFVHLVKTYGKPNPHP